MLEFTVKTVETKSQSPQIKLSLPALNWNGILYSHNPPPLHPPEQKVGSQAKSAGSLKQTGGTEMAEMSRSGTMMLKDTKYNLGWTFQFTTSTTHQSVIKFKPSRVCQSVGGALPLKHEIKNRDVYEVRKQDYRFSQITFEPMETT